MRSGCGLVVAGSLGLALGWVGPDRVSSSEIQRWELGVAKWVPFLSTLGWGMGGGGLGCRDPWISFLPGPKPREYLGWFSLPSPFPLSSGPPAPGFFLNVGVSFVLAGGREGPEGLGQKQACLAMLLHFLDTYQGLLQEEEGAGRIIKVGLGGKGG